MRNEAIRKKRRRRRRIVAFFLIFIIFILIGVIIAGTIFFIKTHQKNNLNGTWEYRINYSDYISLSVDDWIGEKVIDEPVFPPVLVILSLNEDKTYNVAIDEQSYRVCEQEVKKYLESRFTELISDELLLAGYMGVDNVENVSKELLNDTLGESLSDYLGEYEVTFMPSYEDVLKYSSEGTYEYDKKKGIIEFSDSNGKVSREKISITNDVLVFTDSVMYPVTFKRK